MNALKKLQPPIAALGSILLALTLLASAPAQAGELKFLMKDMKTALNGALGSASIPEFTRYLARLRGDVDKAGRLPYADNPVDYREGMLALSANLDKTEQLAKTGDLAAAKQSLQAANQTRKHYHHLLN
ncbi:cytochrome b562 [Chromobacterium piscinae]|uniref:cytochrome b562 n=1 Tax=Chromobacterium piscinae TaxID=686831 RepID=UPI001C8C8D2C|nr:cytochrome b562 [Chromobacterium piscinae]MBX9297165.1 cytochrome B562 [Chromobacterium vaccinii]MBX9358156.1 cytochrome B562 [Chromobacterium vaccinii]MCD5329384.1 cytochrome b562 [Chromobacterium piscinae]